MKPRFVYPLYLIKLVKWEYWTWWLFYLPILPYWLWLALKARSLTFFTAANPGIENGGFFGEPKQAILALIPDAYKPKTLFLELPLSIKKIEQSLEAAAICFPFIIKPNVGERGTNVEKINTTNDLNNYLKTCTEAILIQEFITYDIELGVLFAREPNKDKGKVTSVVIKKFLQVTGDGKQTVFDLMQHQTRARFQIKRFQKEKANLLAEIPHANECRIIEPIGNHCRGTEFISGQHLINDTLHEVFNTIAKPISGFYFGRFDLKVKSFDDLYKGQNIAIMELNGVSSEPAHIYDARYTLFKAYRQLVWHWKLVYVISQQNRKNKVPTARLSWVISEAFKHIFTG